MAMTDREISKNGGLMHAQGLRKRCWLRPQLLFGECPKTTPTLDLSKLQRLDCTWTSATLQYLCPAIKTDDHKNPCMLQLCVDAVHSGFTENNLEMRVPGIYWHPAHKMNGSREV